MEETEVVWKFPLVVVQRHGQEQDEKELPKGDQANGRLRFFAQKWSKLKQNNT
jgi:hypothetical protein